MTEEELYAAQPEKDFKFNMCDENTNVEYRDVVVPNWMARDGRWAEIYGALTDARNGKLASATEKIVKAMERAREHGKQEAETGRKPEGLVRTRNELEYDSSIQRQLEDYRRGRTSWDRSFPKKGTEG